jgi:hypothetical protein
MGGLDQRVSHRVVVRGLSRDCRFFGVYGQAPYLGQNLMLICVPVFERRRPPADGREPPPAADSPTEEAIVAKFVSAYESADLNAVVALLTDDVFMAMLPMPLEYEGRDVVARFCGNIFGAGRRFDLVPTRANGQPAFGAHLCAPTGIRRGTCLFVLTLSGDQSCAMTRFENSVLPWFGLPRSLPSR